MELAIALRSLGDNGFANSYCLIPGRFDERSMTDQAPNWRIHVKKGSYEVAVEGPNPERVEKMFDELVKKYMKKIASP